MYILPQAHILYYFLYKLLVFFCLGFNKIYVIVVTILVKVTSYGTQRGASCV